MRNVPNVSAPRYQVALKLMTRLRAFVENRCRKTFCCTARERCNRVPGGPLRNIECHTCVERRSSKYVPSDFMSHPHVLALGHRGASVHHEVAFVADPDAQ